MFTVILICYHSGLFLLRPQCLSPLSPFPLPLPKFGIVLAQNSTSFPQLRVTISFTISPSFSYKASISLGAIAAGILWIYKSVY